MPNVICTKKRQLLVEGSDAKSFFYPFIEKIEGYIDIEIQDFGSVNKLTDYLKAFVIDPGFRELPVESVGIIRDAEDKCADDAFKSVCMSLQKNNLPMPKGLSVMTPEIPHTGIYILPDCHNLGMLETLILQAVNDDPVLDCIDSYLECLGKIEGNKPNNIFKRKFLSYLAAKGKKVKPLTGYAAKAGLLNFESPVYNDLKKFIYSI